LIFSEIRPSSIIPWTAYASHFSVNKRLPPIDPLRGDGAPMLLAGARAREKTTEEAAKAGIEVSRLDVESAPT
jgi:hypothetical protein